MIRNLVPLLAVFILAGCVSTNAASKYPAATGIAVVKSERKMFLLDPFGNAYREYPIALGANPIGHKEFEGDERTPEGAYLIETRNPDSKYHLSLKVSYPNDADRKHAEDLGMDPGKDIFIHGVPNGKWALEAYMYRYKPTWTDGCIALSNRDMEEVYALVADGTPIEILP